MHAFLRRYLALTIKEVQQLRRNRKLVIQLIVPPTLVLVIFGFALNPKVTDLRLGVVDLDQTAQSRELIWALTENTAFRIRGNYASEADAERDLRRLNLDLFLVVPVDYSRLRARGVPASVQVVVDAVNANTAAIAQGYLTLAAADYNRRLRPRGGTVLNLAGVEARSSVLFNPGLINPWFFVTGVMSVLLFINGSLVASALAVREKEVGTLEQLLMSPAQTMEVLLAKITPVFVVLIAGLFLALLVASLVFDLPHRGSLWLFALSGFLAAFSGIGIGVLLATFSQSQQQSQLLTFFINPPLVTLSGAFAPIESMPRGLQYLSVFDPLRYLIVLVRGVTLKAAGVEVLWPALASLAGCGILLLGLSAWRFRKQLG